MKIKNIPTAAFSNTAGQSEAGFVRLTGFKRLFSHSAFPGIVFKRVGNAAQAMAHGGVLFNVGTELVFIADPSAARLGELRTAVATGVLLRVRAGAVYQRPSVPGTEHYNLDCARVETYGGTAAVNTPSIAMAVVTPCFGIGVAKTPGSTWTDKRNVTTLGENGVSTSLNAGAGGIVMRKEGMLLWREIPFVKSSRDFLKAAVPELVKRYPSSLQSDMEGALLRACDSPEFARPAGLALCYYRDASGEQFGHVPVNSIKVLRANGTASEISISRNATTGDIVPGSANAKPFEYESYSPFLSTDRVKAGVSVWALPRLLVSVPMESVKASLKISRDVTIDFAKFAKDFTPLIDRTPAEGTTDWTAVLATGMIASTDNTATPAEYEQRTDAYSELSAPGGPDLFTDLCNVSTIAEATIAKVATTKNGAGAVFNTPDWSDLGKLRTPDLDKIRGAVRVPRVSGEADGYLLSGPTGAVGTVVETGLYRVTIVGAASEFKQIIVDGVSKPARSRPGKMYTFDVKLYKDTAIGFNRLQPQSLGYIARVVDCQFLYELGAPQLSGNRFATINLRNFEMNDDPSAVFNQGMQDGPFTTALKSYGHAGTAVVAAGMGCVYIEPLLDAPQ